MISGRPSEKCFRRPFCRNDNFVLSFSGGEDYRNMPVAVFFKYFTISKIYLLTICYKNIDLN